MRSCPNDNWSYVSCVWRRQRCQIRITNNSNLFWIICNYVCWNLSYSSHTCFFSWSDSFQELGRPSDSITSRIQRKFYIFFFTCFKLFYIYSLFAEFPQFNNIPVPVHIHGIPGCGVRLPFAPLPRHQWCYASQSKTTLQILLSSIFPALYNNVSSLEVCQNMPSWKHVLTLHSLSFSNWPLVHHGQNKYVFCF